jgi:ribose transport system ATP-binding protein
VSEPHEDGESLVVEMRGIVKSFGVARVLEGVDFTLRAGEVHALVGGNGAGKSTLMKILVGVHTADEGEIRVDGEPVRVASVDDARVLGVAMIFQEFSLIPSLSVARNVFLGREPRGAFGLIDDAATVRRTAEVFSAMGVEVDPRVEVGGLGVAHQQLAEIAKALSREARVLIMDEPTASLAKEEADALLDLARRLARRGVSIVYVSHRMEEILRVSDRVTVLRDGRRVLTAEARRLSAQGVVEHVVGRKVAMGWEERRVARTGTPLLSVRDLRCANGIAGVGFDLFAGEILGFAGLMGSGRTELLRALFGLEPAEGGEIKVRGKPLSLRCPLDAIAAGLALVPEDRRTQGLVLDHSVRDNLLLPVLGSLGRVFLNDAIGEEVAKARVEELRIRTLSTEVPTRLLSGGNQQKVVIGKWLGTEPDVFLLDEPTVGVDVGTKVELIGLMRTLADRGKGIVFVSSELPELLAVSDRVLVLRGGRVSGEFARGEIEGEGALHLAVQGAEGG